MTYLDYLEQKVLLERLVIGLEEPVLIKGLGELSAKIDSGNGGYNVIHGTDFHQQGSELMFTTQDSFGHDKKIQATVIDTIEVNMGGGNIESRPVIELDIKFAGEDYKKIPFSVSDRSSNTNPILISKGFVENELEALIDVGAMNISHDKIDVVYGESFEGKADQTAKKWDDSKTKKGLKMGITAGKAGVEAGKSAAKGAWGALKTLGRGAMGAADWLKGGEDKSLLEPVYGAANMAKDLATGAGGVIAALGGRAAWKKICDIANSVVNGEEIMVTDKKAIQSKLGNTAIPQNLSKQQDADIETTIIPHWNEIDLKSVPIIPVTSFMCNKGENFDDVISGLEQKRKLWKKAIKQAKRAVPEVRNGNDTTQDKPEANNQTEEQEEVLFEYITTIENCLMLEDAVQQMEQSPQGNTNSQGDEEANITPEEVQEVQTDFNNLQNFTLWFVSIKNESSSSTQQLKEVNDELEPLEKKYKELLKQNKVLAMGQDNEKRMKELQEKKKKLEQSQSSSSQTPDKNSQQSIDKIIKSSDAILAKLFSVGNVSNFEPILTNLAKVIQQQGEQGFFVMGYSAGDEGNKREYQFFENMDTIAYTRKENGQQTTEEKPVSEDEEDPWIIEKLNLLKSKEII